MTWYTDKNGNRASLEKWGSKEAARKSLKTLTCCFDCSDCTGCSGCTGCTGCFRCTDCSGCSGCTCCIDCTCCTGCSGCTYCFDCTYCFYCTDFLSPCLLRNVYGYPYRIVVVIKKDGSRWLHMGCLHHSLDEWEAMGGIRNSNLEEFPNDGSERSENRIRAFELAKQIALSL